MAFAVGKAVGNAVVRNRVRRRLRAVLREMASGRITGDAGLAPGTYLLSARPEVADLPYAELSELVAAACTAAADTGAGASAVRR